MDSAGLQTLKDDIDKAKTTIAAALETSLGIADGDDASVIVENIYFASSRRLRSRRLADEGVQVDFYVKGGDAAAMTSRLDDLADGSMDTSVLTDALAEEFEAAYGAAAAAAMSVSGISVAEPKAATVITEVPTEAPEEEDGGMGGGVIAVIIIAAVVGVLGIGYVIKKKKSG